jgi:hypothetical protein
MKKTYSSKGQSLFTLIGVLPFTVALLFALIGLFTLDDISLDPPFRFNSVAVIIFSLVHLSIILILNRLQKIEFSFPKRRFNKLVSIFAHLILVLISNFVLVITLKMNFNSWLKSNKVEKLELIVVDKNISLGKATDYYIIFDSSEGKFHNKVSQKNYHNFRTGESFQASVKRGYFDGYYLSEPLK